MKHVFRVIFSLLYVIIAGLVAGASILTPLSHPAEFSSPITFSNDFETEYNSPQFTFDATAELDTADMLSAGITSSGLSGLKEFVENGPLEVTFASPVREVGLFFGNDDPEFRFQFDAILEVFDAANVSLGSVSVAANQNDYVDQYLGARSDTPIARATITYQRPQAGELAVFIDDFTIGAGVPEPTGLLLAFAGLIGIAAGARFRRCS